MRRLLVLLAALCVLAVPVSAQAAPKPLPGGVVVVPVTPHPSPPAKATKLWACPNHPVAICEAFVNDWRNPWQHPYTEWWYSTAPSNFIGLTWDCWHNTAWTDQNLIMRCKVRLRYWVGGVDSFLEVQFNAKHVNWNVSNPVASCHYGPYPYTAFTPNPGKLVVYYSSHPPSNYRCIRLERMAGDYNYIG